MRFPQKRTGVPNLSAWRYEAFNHGCHVAEACQRQKSTRSTRCHFLPFLCPTQLPTSPTSKYGMLGIVLQIAYNG